MSIKIKFIMALILLSSVFFISGVTFAAGNDTAQKDASAITGSMARFELAFKLYSRIKTDGNLFFSPYSISTALTMTYTGARGNTAQEMANVLGLPSIGPERVAAAYSVMEKQLQSEPETKDYELNIANALWGQKGYGFLPDFIELNKKYFGSGLTELDFEKHEDARQIINKWVEDKTKEKIKDLITKGALDDPLIRLVLTNAIYFKGNWAVQFKKEETKPADFNVTKEQKVQVQMMHQKGTFDYGESDNVQILQMPYKGDDLAMMIILPKTSTSIEAINEQMAANPFLVIASADRKKLEVDVYLPKFKITFGTVELKDVLIDMGMKDAFSAEAADFSGMNGRKTLYIHKVLHKAFVEVNEEGTEAAAATAVIMKERALPRPAPVFRADRPFIFMILDTRSQNILFMGRVVNPTLQGE